MASCDETNLGACNPYFYDPCPYCGGSDVMQNCVDASQGKEMNDTIEVASQTWLMGLF